MYNKGSAALLNGMHVPVFNLHFKDAINHFHQAMEVMNQNF